ncbi:MAG: tetratricopeptide repeat protein [Planctomycetes bacterium]|nr:tetratricopeptide repeat protein [Planctomycetota bacterium]
MLDARRTVTAALIVAAAFVAGCRTPKVSLKVKRPPTLELPPVKVLAVDDLDPATPEDKAVAAYVKSALIASINREGAIQAMDFREAKERAAKEGMKIEAVLRGRVWTDFVHLTGMQEPVITSDVVWERTDKGLEYIAEARDKVGYQQYEIVKAFVSIQLNLVQLSGPEEKTIAALSGGRGWRERVGGGPARVMDLWSGRAESAAAPGDRSRDALLRVSADKAVAEFTRAVSPHSETIEAVIAKGGDGSVPGMLRGGQYDQVISRLEPNLKSPTKERAPDLYNLGLAYEALGEPALLEAALVFYRKALDFDPENEDYAAGIGRVEQLMRDRSRMSN